MRAAASCCCCCELLLLLLLLLLLPKHAVSEATAQIAAAKLRPLCQAHKLGRVERNGHDRVGLSLRM